ncbi:hypothetical protein Rfer_4362 (plasmid) [Rhodoferax ferrireducens T118]|uniref:Uncharacterized protein n=1 Tax=Albidiferax ferrireducens (strain ATCC BAA-621 / DSM 15236 / T118) TaxID=338969 RepID=Q21Q97_ALBFT|nr:methyltransferase [Rhodoferax ferrireducens]ABD72048.1 hypothetical protein Rfer_4362 [Rhodoferax ferrireducens T118]
MKQHLVLMCEVPDIEQILAIRSLFQCEWTFNEDNPERLRTVNAEGEPGKRVMFAADSDEPLLWATTRSDKIEITVSPAVNLPDELHLLLRAMGLKECGRSPEGISLDSTDDEVLFDRISTLDAAWILLRRLKQFETDVPSIQTSAIAILEFAQNWKLNCARVSDRRETKAMMAHNDMLEEQASRFAEWNVAGLNGIKLNYDPRGSALALLFENNHPMDICALTFNWPVGQGLNPNAQRQKAKSGKYDIRPTRIASDVQGILNGLAVLDCKVKIAQRLPPRLYAKVNELLTTIGGQWSTAQQAHVFAEDPTPMLETLTATGEVYTARDYEFFATQPALASQVIAEAGILPGMVVIEPNAGDGALAMAAAEIVGKSNVICYELMPQNVKTLTALGFHLQGPQDFLAVKPEAVADRITMNPPFSGGRDMAHIRHAMEFLKPGGVLVSIASTQWQTHDTKPAKAFQAYLMTLGAKVIAIPAGAFKASGTDVATTLLVLKKPLNSKKAPPVAQAVDLQQVQAALF